MEKLSEKYKFSVVVSSGGLRCIVDNHAPDFDRQWEVPIVIKEQKISGMATIHGNILTDN